MGSSAALVRQVEVACGSGMSAKSLRERVLALLRPEVPYDGHIFTLTDPVTLVATAPHADLPMLPWEQLPEIIRLRYLTPTNRVDAVAGRPATSLRTASDHPEQSARWRRALAELGVRDTAIVAFADRYGVWGYLELWRTTTPFAPTELDLLSQLVPVLAAGLRATVARTFSEAAGSSLPSGPAVVLLGPDLRVLHQTDGAASTLLHLLPPDEQVPPIPAAAYNLGAALIAQEQGIAVGEPRARIHLGSGHWVTGKASRLGDGIAVSIEPSTPGERLEVFARAAGLSERESEVTTLLGNGLDTREIAGHLVISEHTVNDHVKAVLAKTGARSRHALLARLAGSPPG